MTSTALAAQLGLLPTTILETHASRSAEFRNLSRELRIGLGWHYLLDLVWASEELVSPAASGGTILDAGAGLGLMQWWLAEHGATVISVDRAPRHVSRRLRARYDVSGVRSCDQISLRRAALGRLLRPGASRNPLRVLAGACRDLILGEPRTEARGAVRMYRADLSNVEQIASNSVDAVVSISSLEHNPPERLPAIVAELMRVIKPGGKLVATLSAAKERDWFHQPSRGWCYTEATLRAAFGLDGCASNYSQYDALFRSLRQCAPLCDQLADFYRQSGDNGMPWGIWSPQYQPVGIVKVKQP